VEIETLKNDIVAAISIVLDERLEARFDAFEEKLYMRLGKIEEDIKLLDARLSKVEQNIELLNVRLSKVEQDIELLNTRFGKMEQDIGRLEIIIEEMDDKFTLITEGQDIIREILEVRVARIEDVLAIRQGV